MTTPCYKGDWEIYLFQMTIYPSKEDKDVCGYGVIFWFANVDLEVNNTVWESEGHEGVWTTVVKTGDDRWQPGIKVDGLLGF